MHRLTRVVGLLCLAALLAACPRPVRPPPEPTVRPEQPADTSGAAIYDIDPDSSRLHIQVFRGGTLARLGHNHVMTAQHLSGRVWVHPEFSRSGFELILPVRELVVDDPEARRLAGSDFPPEIPPADKEGTRRNMLKPAVLDGERYPQVSVRAAHLAGTLEAPRITARITIKGVSRDVEVPVEITVRGRRLNAAGVFDIRQSDFGIQPFNVALGALAVQDRLHIELRIVAERSE